MVDIPGSFSSGPEERFAGSLYRICAARHLPSVLSMRGAYLYGGRYNLREYFGALYTSLDIATARKEAGRYYTVPPREGLVEVVIGLRLSRVVNLTRGRLEDLTSDSGLIPQEIGLRAWEAGVEGLLAPSAAVTGAVNLVVFLDNQRPGWRIELRRYRL